MFNHDLTNCCGWSTRANVERGRWGVAVDIGVTADICAPRLTERRAGRHEEEVETGLLALIELKGEGQKMAVAGGAGVCCGGTVSDGDNSTE